MSRFSSSLLLRRYYKRCTEDEVGEKHLGITKRGLGRGSWLIAHCEDNSKARREQKINTPRARSLINKRPWDGSASVWRGNNRTSESGNCLWHFLSSRFGHPPSLLSGRQPRNCLGLVRLGLPDRPHSLCRFNGPHWRFCCRPL